MNVLQILPALDIGGVETGTVDLARYLAAKGHKAIVVSGPGRLVKELESTGARHYALPVGRKNIITMARMVGQLCNIIRREDIDIVHARSRVPAIIAYVACKITNRAFITTAHGYYKKHPFSAAMGWGKFVIVASNIMAKHMEHSFGVPHHRLRLIPRGVDLEKFRPRSKKARDTGEYVIGMISRITPLKGHSDFIKAVAVLNKDIPKLKAVIVGAAPKEKYREDLELLIRRLGLSRVVEFTGAKSDIPEVIRGMDLVVCATVTPEAFGRTIIEAQAIGVPVVSTAVGGVVDIIDDGENGLLCTPQDPNDMARKIMKVYNDSSLRDKLVTSARRRVESLYKMDTMMEKTLAVYDEAIKVRNILVIKMSALGDVILVVPSLRAIRSAFPSANIKVLVGVQARDALDRCPYINDMIVCDLSGKHAGTAGLWKLGGKLREEAFDMAIDFQNNRKSHILSMLSMAPLRFGYDNRKFSFLLNRRIRDDAPYLDPIEHQFRVLKLAGVKPVTKDLELWPSSQDEERVHKFLQDNWSNPNQPLVGINVRASSRWLTKNWPSSHIAELCDRLAKEFGVRAVLTGSDSDFDYASGIARASKSKPIVAAGRTTVMELASLMKHFKAYLTPDSAPMHISSAMHVPFVAIFGPTDPVRHLAASKDCIVMCKAGELKCSPCYSPSCSKKLLCMKKIAVDEVVAAMRDFIRRGEN